MITVAEEKQKQKQKFASDNMKNSNQETIIFF